jgi:predicted  nucleic acid-binding Zn-ribbon protein
MNALKRSHRNARQIEKKVAKLELKITNLDKEVKDIRSQWYEDTEGLELKITNLDKQVKDIRSQWSVDVEGLEQDNLKLEEKNDSLLYKIEELEEALSTSVSLTELLPGANLNLFNPVKYQWHRDELSEFLKVKFQY